MKLIPIKKDEIPAKKGHYNPTKLFLLLQEFVNSEHEVARIDEHEYKTAGAGVQSIRAAIKRYKMHAVHVFYRQNVIYLEKEL